MNLTVQKNELIFGYSSGNLSEAKSLFVSMYLYLNSLAAKNSKIFEREAPHFHDKSKKSIVDQTDFYPESSGFARISCTDWSEEFLTKHGWEDVLKVVIGSEEFNIFLRDDAYD